MRLLKIGKDASCDIVMHSNKVSSLHAELTLLNSGDILLEDKGSLNGTFIMNQPIKPNKPVKVRRGDAIRFADVELQWSQVPMPEDNSAYKGVYGIGSHFNNDLQISGATVSRYHATVKHGRDGKMYLIDHSKNGTTVNGTKIPHDTPVVIKKKSSVACGGVPVDLSKLPWPSNPWPMIIGVVAAVVVLLGAGVGIWKLVANSNREWNTTEIYDRYSSSVVLIQGAYHYEVTAGSLTPQELYSLGIPTRLIPYNGGLADASTLSDAIVYMYGAYYGTGFFISDDAKIVTNLHVVKPWLEESNQELIKQTEEELKRMLAKQAEIRGTYFSLQYQNTEGLSAYVSQLKIEGKSDGVFFVPNGRYFSSENATKCTVLSAGDDINVDVALIQSDKMELPNKKATYVNVTDSIDCSEDALKVGKKMFTVGFPHGMNIQEYFNEKGVQAFVHSGSITRESNEYYFQFDAVSAGGASGSPVFNEYGKLIGVVNAGVPNENINYAIKAKYVKELLEKPHKK